MAVPTQHWLFQARGGFQCLPGASLLPLRLGVHSRSLPAVPIGIISASIFAHTDQADIQGKPTLFQVFCDFQLAATRSPKMRLTVVEDPRVKLFEQEILSPFSQTQTELNCLCPETALAGVSPCDLPAGSCVLRSVPSRAADSTMLQILPWVSAHDTPLHSRVLSAPTGLSSWLCLYTNFHQL